MPVDYKLNQVEVPTVAAALGLVLMLDQSNKASSTECVFDLANAFFSIQHSAFMGPMTMFIYNNASGLC